MREWGRVGDNRAGRIIGTEAQLGGPSQVLDTHSTRELTGKLGPPDKWEGHEGETPVPEGPHPP